MSNLPESCVPFDEDLSALLDGELAPEREAAVRAHLHGCTGCRDRLEALCSVDLALAGTALPDVPDGLRERIEQRIDDGLDGEREAPQRPPRRRRTGPAVGSAFALAASLAVYIAVGRAPDPFDEASAEELAVVLEIDTIEDLDVIANLEILERLLELERGSS